MGNRRALDPGWHICPNTPDTVRVCGAYPWQAGTLAFADGSAIYTGVDPDWYEVGLAARDTEALIQEDGLYGTDWFFCPDAHYDKWSAIHQSSDVFIRRKLPINIHFFLPDRIIRESDESEEDDGD